MVVGVDDDPAREVARGVRDAARGASRSPSLNILLTSTCWRNDHNGFSHQGPGLIDTIALEEGGRSRASTCRPTPTACSRSPTTACAAANYVNLIVIDKQPQLQWLDIDAAREHCARGASVWAWASNDGGGEPDVVLACAGDIADAGDRRGGLAAAPARARAARCASSTSST